MKKQNLQNGIFILVISGVFYHTFTLPMKPKVGRGIASVTSRYCDERTGAGLVGSVCYGEDWWLPSSVEENSIEGNLYAYFTHNVGNESEREDGYLEGDVHRSMLKYITGTENRCLFSSMFPDLIEGSDLSDQGKGIVDSYKAIWSRNTEQWCHYMYKDNTGISYGRNFIDAGSTETQYAWLEARQKGESSITTNGYLSGTGLVKSCPDLTTGSPRFISTSVFTSDKIKRISCNGWDVETGSGMTSKATVPDANSNNLKEAYYGFKGEEFPLDSGDDYENEQFETTLNYFRKTTEPNLNWQRISDVYREYEKFLNGGIHIKSNTIETGANNLNNFWAFRLNGESGFWPNYLAEGFVCLEEDLRAECTSSINYNWTEVAEKHSQVALDSGLPPEYFMVKISQGGTAFVPIVNEVYKHGFSLGTGGAFGIFSNQFLQHIKHLEYRNDLSGYVSNYEVTRPPRLHIDMESMFDQDSNTWGDYRVFRLAALSAVAYRFNSIVTMSGGIITEGQLDCGDGSGRAVRRCQNFKRQYDAGILNHSGALKMHTWLKKILGKEKEKSIDGWCAPMHMGQPVGETGLSGAITEFRDSFDDNSEKQIFEYSYQVGRKTSDSCRYREAYAPLKKFVGHHCKMTTQGVPGIKMDWSWIPGYGEPDDEEAGPCIAESILPSLTSNCKKSDWTLSSTVMTGKQIGSTCNPMTPDDIPSEGRGTSSVSKSLMFEFDNYLFKNPNEKNIVVKIVLRPKTIIAGTPRVGKINVAFTHGDRTAVQSKQFAQTDFSSDSRYISTLTLKFARRGAEAAKVRISHDSGGHFDYLMVRVIPTEE
jgi:hypothetical protein